MSESVGDILRRHFQQGDYLAAFELIYAQAEHGGNIPWAEGAPHPLLSTWSPPLAGAGKTALVVGCGTGEDAEFLAARGFAVTAFDIAPSAIQQCQTRFPQSTVQYVTADLLKLPTDWHARFDFVLECRTLQALPWQYCPPAMLALTRLLTPNGQLLVICLGREPAEDRRGIPWALSRAELATFTENGLREVQFDDFPHLPRRHFRILYTQKAHL
jgi:2-polyprenyl-3-methyl-5-hydroxy-6-metoxy-1,4-benzoquinol methylase